MNEIERKAAIHATWRVFTIVIAIVAGICGAGFGVAWLVEHLGPGSLALVGSGLLLSVAIVGMWRAIFSYTKRQLLHGTPKKDWWF